MKILHPFYFGRVNWLMSNNKIIKKVNFEIKQIDKLMQTYRDLIEKCKDTEPEIVELTALASVIHSFYNGVENIFLLIAKNIDKDKPEGAKWHKDLLLQMTDEINKRPAVISDEMKDKLKNYLGFRHFYRHSYSFFLDWEEIKSLVSSLTDTWEQLKRELKVFLKKERNNDIS